MNPFLQGQIPYHQQSQKATPSFPNTMGVPVLVRFW
jgi:hypothetical protein